MAAPMQCVWRMREVWQVVCMCMESVRNVWVSIADHTVHTTGRRIIDLMIASPVIFTVVWAVTSSSM